MKEMCQKTGLKDTDLKKQKSLNIAEYLSCGQSSFSIRTWGQCMSLRTFTFTALLHWQTIESWATEWLASRSTAWWRTQTTPWWITRNCTCLVCVLPSGLCFQSALFQCQALLTSPTRSWRSNKGKLPLSKNLSPLNLVTIFCRHFEQLLRGFLNR